MMQSACILVLAAACCFGVSYAQSGPTGYRNCSTQFPPAPDGNTSNVTLSPCPSDPCQVKKGSNATAFITFTPAVDVENLTAVVHGKLENLSILIPFNLPDPNGCDSKQSNVTCPLKAGQQYYYITSVPIPSDAPPGIKVTVFFELQNEKKEDVVCVDFEVEIT